MSPQSQNKKNNEPKSDKRAIKNGKEECKICNEMVKKMIKE